MPEEKMEPLSEEEKQQIEEKLKKEEELEELYGHNPYTEKRIKKEYQKKYGQTGGTRGGQWERARTCRYYSGKKRKSAE